MNTTHRKSFPLLLPVVISILMAAQSILGILLPNLYHDNQFVMITWKGNDLVTLMLVLPIFIVGLFYAKRGSLKAKLIVIGVLDYCLYNYAFYLFAAAFNAFFLLYVALFGLSIFALIITVTNIDLDQIRLFTHPKMPVKLIAGYMFFVAFGLTLVYTLQSIGYIFTGALPDIVIRSGHPTSIVFALDLTLLIPFFVIGAVLLLKRNPWGTVITSAILVKGPLYTIILSFNTYLVSRLTGSSELAEMPLWIGLTVLGMTAVFFVYKNLKAE